MMMIIISMLSSLLSSLFRSTVSSLKFLDWSYIQTML